jgi:glycosyltransferase involved in cell wall biosynthesis
VTDSNRHRLISLLITRIVAPAAGRVQGCLHPPEIYGCNGNGENQSGPLVATAKFLNWVNQGLITLAFPEMRYNPVTARRQLAATQWASLITGLPPEELREQYRHYVRSVAAAPAVPPGPIRFSILISFHRHYRFLQRCLDSVADACAAAPDVTAEVLLVNDDPSFSVGDLEGCVNPLLRKLLRLHHNGANLGICASTNLALKRAQGDWVIYLDCDDELEPDAIKVLEAVTRKRPAASFISSRAVDIDQDNEILARRLRLESPLELINHNNASHLKAIRRDLHDRIGYLEPTFEGCQDYEFALRTSLFEPLLFIPQYLYRYRWHSHSQTVSEAPRQNNTVQKIRQIYMLVAHWLTDGLKEINAKCEGPFAEEWMRSLGAANGSGSIVTPTEAQVVCEHAWNERRQKLLFMDLAREMIERYYSSRKGPVLAKVPA